MDRIVGIDLGTSTSCLAVVVDGEPVVAPDSRGNRVTPSYIHIMEDGRILVGPQAKAEVISDPYSTIWATKRLIGRRYNDPEIQLAKQYYGYDILPAEDGGVIVRGRDKDLSPTEVSAIILKYLTRIGRKALGEDIRRCIITVPAYFTDPQRKATREAGTMIGLDVVRLINEPTAAALAYGYDSDAEETVALFDLGGGTFDLSILSIGQGVFEVVATDGDSYLGGEDFDNKLVDYLVKDFQQKFKINIHNDKMAHQRVKDAAERAKIALSDKDEVEVNLPGICPDLNRWAGIENVISRKLYDGLVMDLVDRTLVIFKKLLKDAGMTVKDLDNIVLVGGMTRMPLVRNKVADFIEREPDLSLHPDESVAIGAAIHGASLSGEKLKRHKKPAQTPPPPQAERPGLPLDLDRTTPGTPAGQDLTMPGMPAAAIQDMTMPGTPAQAVQDLTQPGTPAPEVLQEMTSPGLPPPMVVEEPMPPLPEDLLPLDPSRAGVSEQELEMLTGEVEFDESEPPPAIALGDLPPPQGSLDDFFQPSSAPPETAPEEPPSQDMQDLIFESPAAEAEPEPEEEPVSMDEAGEHEEPGFQGIPVDELPVTESDEPLAVCDDDLLPADPSMLGDEPEPSEFVHDLGEVVEEAELGEPPPADLDERPVSAGPLVKDYEVEGPAPEPVPETAAPMPDLSVPDEAPMEDTSAAPAPTEEEVLPEEEEPEAAAEEEAAPEYYDAPVLLDVLSQSVGLAHFGGHYVPIIKRFAKLPARATQVFTTCADNQERIKIKVLQGESKYDKDNTPLGEFVLAGIEKARRGVAQIEVSFDIDQSGLFIIAARDVNTGVAREIKLEGWAKPENA